MGRYISKTIVKKPHTDGKNYFYIKWVWQSSFFGILLNKFSEETDRICFKTLSQAEDYCNYASAPIKIVSYTEGGTYRYAILKGIKIDVEFSHDKDVPRFCFGHYKYATKRDKSEKNYVLAKDIFLVRNSSEEIVKTYKI